MDSLVSRVLDGDVRAVARAITLVENRAEGSSDIVKGLFRHTGRARLVGLTGSPGVGKSTLANKLIGAFRARGLKVAVVAVDPTSPFTGGALLGDRVRMSEHYLDPGVFIRSMATRGRLGGISAATADAADILDAAGFDIVLLETVGVGQDEVDIARVAYPCVVILVPGLGDELQTFKAGIMEIADIFVINKADLAGADRLHRELTALLSTSPGGPEPDIVLTRATTGEGIPALADRLFQPAGLVPEKIAARKLEQAEKRLVDILCEKFLGRVREHPGPYGGLRACAEKIASRAVDPFTAAEAVMASVLSGRKDSP